MESKRWSRKSLWMWITLALVLMLLGQSGAGVLWLRGAFLDTMEEAEERSAREEQSCIVRGMVVREEQLISAPAGGNWQVLPECGSTVGADACLAVNVFRGTRMPGWSLEAETEASLKLTLPQRRQRLREAIGSRHFDSVQGTRLAAAHIRDTVPAEETPLWNGEIHAPSSGIFSPGADQLTVHLSEKEPEGLLADYGRIPQAEREENILGRVITGDTWYWVGRLPFSIGAGEYLSGLLLGGVFREADFLVECCRSGEKGTVVVLSCNQCTADVSDIRYLTVNFMEN